MKMKAKKYCIKAKFKKIGVYLLPIVKREISNQINKIKSHVIHKILPNKRQNTLKYSMVFRCLCCCHSS